MDRVEPQVLALYDGMQILPEWRERVRACLREDADADLGQRQREVARLKKRLAQLAVEKKSLAISLRKAPAWRKRSTPSWTTSKPRRRPPRRGWPMPASTVRPSPRSTPTPSDYLTRLSLAADEHGRRLLNQFFFEKVLVKGHKVVGAIYTETARFILGYPPGPVGPGGQSTASESTFHGETNPDPLSGVRGSNIDSVVGAAGVEPATARV